MNPEAEIMLPIFDTWDEPAYFLLVETDDTRKAFIEYRRRNMGRWGSSTGDTNDDERKKEGTRGT